MKIKSVKVTSYGKLKEKTIDFAGGINIIYGKNEAGKTTLMTFIKGMLYGFSGKGTGLKNERKKYLPWDGNCVSGEIRLETDSGKELAIMRSCGKTAATDKCTIIDSISGEKCDFSAEKEIGFGEEAFLKMLFIKQLSSAIKGEDDEITAKLINLSSGGDEDTCYHRAVDVLEDGIKEYKHKRGDGGLINDIKRKIMQLREELEAEERFEQECLAAEKRCRQLESETEKNLVLSSETEKRIEKIKKLLRLKKLEKEKNEYNRLKLNLEKKRDELTEALERLGNYSAFSVDLSEKAFEPEEDTSALDNERANDLAAAKKVRVISIVLICIGAVALAAGFLSKVFLAASAVMLCAGMAIYTVGRKNSKHASDISERLEKIKEREREKLEELSKYGCASLKEYVDKKAEYTAILAKCNALRSERDALESEFSATMPKPEWDEVREGSETCSEAELEEAQRNYSRLLTQGGELKRELAELRTRLKTANEGHRTSVQIREEIYFLSEKLGESEESLSALNAALETLNEAYSMVSKNFAPKLNTYASEILKRITSGEHGGFTVDKQYNVTMDKGGLKELEYFSAGTVEQVYLALRLALVKMLGDGKRLPMFFDDSFVLFDSEREANAMKIIEEFAKDSQVFFFTCNEKYVKNNDYNIIRL